MLFNHIIRADCKSSQSRAERGTQFLDSLTNLAGLRVIRRLVQVLLELGSCASGFSFHFIKLCQRQMIGLQFPVAQISNLCQSDINSTQQVLSILCVTPSLLMSQTQSGKMLYGLTDDIWKTGAIWNPSGRSKIPDNTKRWRSSSLV